MTEESNPLTFSDLKKALEKASQFQLNRDVTVSYNKWHDNMIEIGFNEDEIKDCFQKMKRKQKTLTCVDNCQKYDILILSGDWNINQLKKY